MVRSFQSFNHRSISNLFLCVLFFIAVYVIRIFQVFLDINSLSVPQCLSLLRRYIFNSFLWCIPRIQKYPKLNVSREVTIFFNRLKDQVYQSHLIYTACRTRKVYTCESGTNLQTSLNLVIFYLQIFRSQDKYTDRSTVVCIKLLVNLRLM